MIKRYFINFWAWWYGVRFQSLFHTIFSLWSLALANLNILPMASNLFVPMFQDQSLIGKFLSFILRINWVIWGSILMFFLSIPLVLVLVGWILLPLVTIFQIINSLI